jgi:hypothetical protein
LQNDKEVEYTVVPIRNYDNLYLPFTYTVIDPRTMMIEPLHALIAYIAMPASRGPDNLTVWTQAVRLKVIK